MDELQASVFDFLENPASHGGEKARRIDTHAAVVFLAGSCALKVKRAVSFPFLDYSTLDKRKAACLSELEVNRRFAPDLYRKVVPITREGNGRFAIDGHGDVIEWAVEMDRFDENQTLNNITDRRELDSRLAEKLASMVLAMHQDAQRADPIRWLEAIETYIQQNTEAFRTHPDIFAVADVVRLERNQRQNFQRLKPQLLERGERGFVRFGHGDLHLENIVLVDGKPIAFDAIEFSPVIASGDVLYDLSFLLMDLIERGHNASANIVLNVYVGSFPPLEELDGLASLPLFMSLRAAIRAKVIADRIGRSKESAPRLKESARRYFDLALALLEPSQPLMVCIGGLSGVGKSTIARQLAEAIRPLPGALVLRSDTMRKQMSGHSEFERLPTAAYDAAASARVYAELSKRAIRIVRANYSVIIDATFATDGARETLERHADRAGVTPVKLFMIADLDTRISRIEQRGPDASDADANLARQQQHDLDRVSWHKIDASGSPAQTLRQIRDFVLQEQARRAAASSRNSSSRD